MIVLGYLSETKYNTYLKKIQRENKSKERKLMLREERRKHNVKFKLPSTSKLVLLVVFLLCIEILVFCEYAMIALGDASAMYALIGVPATLVPVIISYYNKSKAENTVNGIVYETAMAEKNAEKNQDNEEAAG